MQTGREGRGGADTPAEAGAAAAPPAPHDRSDAPARVAIETILRGRQEVIIQHRNEEYRLRITSNGKLLLTK